MEIVLDEGVQFILTLQKSWDGWEKEMLFLSKVGDPRNSFLIYFPLAYHFNHNLGVSVLWTTIISEWLNLVLKWVLRGDRPYWWVHESSKWQNVTIQQYELTCETGPGSPSGHSMITSAVLCLLVSWLLDSIQENLLCNMSILGKLIVKLSLWVVLMIILIFVSVSRVFIATHFPHQVIMGTVIGLIVALVVKNYKTVLINTSGSVRYCALCSLTLVISTFASYLFLSFLVYDPSISVAKAQKWCIKPSYIHLDTTPFYAMVRDSGATLGLGISVGSVSSAVRGRGNWQGLHVGIGQLSSLSASLKVTLSILLLQLLEVISLPKSSPLLFYVAGYVRCAFIPIVVILIVPLIAVWQ